MLFRHFSLVGYWIDCIFAPDLRHEFDLMKGKVAWKSLFFSNQY